MMMDNDLTQDIQKWLDTPKEKRDVKAGAEMLLRLDRNRFLYRNILARPERMHGKLEYELNKHLRIRLDGMTLADVAKMESSVMPAVKDTLHTHAPVPEGEDDEQPALFVGKRDDHDSLPEKIRELYDKNGELFFKIKQLYNHLLTMEHAPACDRYEYLKQLGEADQQYRKNWEEYDTYQEKEDGAAGASVSGASAVVTANRISAARKFISQNRKKLENTDAGTEEYGELLSSIQEKIDLVLRSGGSFKPDFRAELEHLGLVFE